MILYLYRKSKLPENRFAKLEYRFVGFGHKNNDDFGIMALHRNMQKRSSVHICKENGKKASLYNGMLWFANEKNHNYPLLSFYLFYPLRLALYHIS